MLCEEIMIIIKTRSTLSIPQNTKQAAPPKAHNNIGKTNKYCTNHGMINYNVETCRKKKEQTIMASHEGNTTKSKTTKDIFVCMSHLWFEWT
jgi:hypothetical protein